MPSAVASGARNRSEESFFSVFPKTHFTTPTPESTPNIGTISSPGQPFGGFNTTGTVADEAVRFNRAWSAATRFLTLTTYAIDSSAIEIPSEVPGAFLFLLESTASRKDLIAWYNNQIAIFFRGLVLPTLQRWQQPIMASEASGVLSSTVNALMRSQKHFLCALDALVIYISPERHSQAVIKFRAEIKRSLHNLVLHSLPRQRLQSTLASVAYLQMRSSLQAGSNPEKCQKDNQCHCALDLSTLPLRECYEVGLGGVMGERALANAVHLFLRGPAIERRCLGVDWDGHTLVMPRLRTWVSSQLLPVIEGALAAITGNGTFQLAENDSRQFISIAVINLGRLRTVSLFDYVTAWPASTGAILDIRDYISAGSQAEKAHVCQSFMDQVQRRLLHAGATTSEILSFYVNVIYAFRLLDSRGVLLEKVAAPLRSYLRWRDDTNGIIAASFLAHTDQNGNVIVLDMGKICPDITLEVSNSAVEDSQDNKMLNWDDMDWMPDPIDAGPDYKSSRTDDVVANILGLFEQDDFIKEVTTLLGHQLLHASDSEYVKETRIIELLKSRLDETKLQAAEVMLKDVRDSVTLGKRIIPSAASDSTQSAPTPREIQAAIPEEGITLSSLYSIFEGRMKRAQFLAAVKLVANKRNDLFYAKRTRIPADPPGSADRRKEKVDIKAQIVSSYFWPQLRSNEFNMPQDLEPLWTGFEQRFNTLGTQRKLQFRPALARVSLRLDLEDRTHEELDLPGWRASVIDAFGSTSQPGNDGAALQYDAAIGLTVEQLIESLNMEEELVLDALSFWTGKRVLYQMQSSAFAVLEQLDMDVDAVQQQVQPQENLSAVMSQDAMLRQSAPMFETFIANMLINGPKEVGGITSLLKMVVPGFTYGDEEVKWLLGEMERKGQVATNGGVWKTAP